LGHRAGDIRGTTKWTAFLIGTGTLAVILLLKGSKRLPGILIAVVAATAMLRALDLAARSDVAVLWVPFPQVYRRSRPLDFPGPTSSQCLSEAAPLPWCRRRHERALAGLRRTNCF